MKLPRFRNPKATFSLICGLETQYKYKQYYEKQATLKRVHIQEGEGKRRKLRK
jgi:hypothetical protein